MTIRWASVNRVLNFLNLTKITKFNLESMTRRRIEGVSDLGQSLIVVFEFFSPLTLLHPRPPRCQVTPLEAPHHIPAGMRVNPQ